MSRQPLKGWLRDKAKLLAGKDSGSLCLTRRVGESLLIDKEILITFIKCPKEGDNVRAVITCDKKIPIDRYDRELNLEVRKAD